MGTCIYLLGDKIILFMIDKLTRKTHIKITKYLIEDYSLIILIMLYKKRIGIVKREKRNMRSAKVVEHQL